MKEMKRNPLRGLFLVSLVTGLVLLTGQAAFGASIQGCPPFEPADAPTATISNGLVNAVVFLPDTQKGFYRGTRFDWSGAVWCLTYKGHNYFGPWYAKNNTRMKDPITGPVEDYRAADGRSATGYDAAKPGGLFVKPGIGVLRRIDEKPYSFQAPYPIVDTGKWTVRPGKSQVSFRHDLNTQLGISYRYEKKLKLEAHEPILVIEHALKNTGKDTIDIQVYNHDFFVFDGATTGPGMVARFPFTPKLARPLENGAHLEGNQIIYDREIGDAPGPATEISGFSDKASDFDFVVENTKTGVGVEEIGSVPLSKIVFWSNALTVAPEAYVHITIPPGGTGRWSIRYRFFAK